jgi:PPOX class probable F420-dependent enzyme
MRKDKPACMKGQPTIDATRAILTTPGVGHQAVLTTYRRNGQGVSTRVGIIVSNGKLYFMTAANTWKVKRLANNPRVQLALYPGRGKASGPVIEGVARRLFADELRRARALLRVGLLGHVWSFIFDVRNPGDKTAVYEIELMPACVDPADRAVFPAMGEK